jgi:3',5'-cyclic AMP phosphodiesterase CpdA
MLIAHLSDLHIGRDAATDRAAELLAEAVEDAGVASVIVTGDVTHRGRTAELSRFEALFRRLDALGRLVVVPGNHDRLGDGAAAALMPGGRVAVASRPGLYVVRVDSTGPHNRRLLSAHGLLTEADLAAVDSALEAAPEGALTVLALHHHPLALPPDALSEHLSDLLGWPNAAELQRGGELLALARSRCDLVLHGHRHIPSEHLLGAGDERPLRVANAGSTTELLRFRVFAARGGRVDAHGWVEVEGDGSMPWAGAWIGPTTAWSRAS